ncbi:MAG: transglycosylase SLT domain-containing protein, partial [Rubrivivax sp.]|nr:transglycosylase SLT domain-containing protein [Rubrivivax sp.]
WRYWRARALLASGQRVAANALFVTLSREHTYYGQLAQEELGAVMQVPAINIKVGGGDIAEIARHPGIVRAQALYQLGLRQDANLEWNWAIRTFSDQQLLAAAELARRMEWYDRAINTAERTRELHDFDLRFIAPYRELAQRAARENDLDEAWIFGLMRQESRFINVARSSVGASGLMQIMPTTARWIAQRLGIKGFDPKEMQDPAKNIQFGAYYLKHVQTTLDGSPVLATAAYNAGPSRAQRWRDVRPMESAVYIESIPFTETRDYVKKVMSNAMYYAVRFGQPSVLLKDRLGTVPPRRMAAVAGMDADPAQLAESTEETP